MTCGMKKNLVTGDYNVMRQLKSDILMLFLYTPNVITKIAYYRTLN